jgi:hypothetical protein
MYLYYRTVIKDGCGFAHNNVLAREQHGYTLYCREREQ